MPKVDPHLFEPTEPGSTACLRCPFHANASVHNGILMEAPPIEGPAPIRISRHAMFLEIVQAIRKRSSCVRGQVGVVIVRDARIIAMGYNGAPRGMPQCDEVGCEVPDETAGCQRSIHAELNAIAWSARAGTPTDGCTMYSTHSPCKSCAQAIVAAGISHFIYINSYRAARLDVLQDAGIVLDCMGPV